MTVYAPAPTAPRVPRPPLTSRAKRGARIAGILTLVLVLIGWAPFAMVMLFVGVVFVAYLAASAFGGYDPLGDALRGPSRYVADTLGVPVGALPTVALVACAVGLVLIVLAIIFLSPQILKRHQVNRPIGVTLSALGVSVVGLAIVNGIAGMVVSAVDRVSGSAGGISTLSVPAVVTSFVVSIASSAVVGWLAWWWMAYLFRPPALPAEVNSQQPASESLAAAPQSTSK